VKAINRGPDCPCGTPAGSSAHVVSPQAGQHIFLMTMHDFEFDNLLDIIRTVRGCIPRQTQIVVNIGDFDRSQAERLRTAGIQGAYHVCRLREGVDTALSPEQRKKTFRTIREAGLDFYYCCEPIGPEHTPEELVEQMFVGIEYGCFQHAAMRRVWVPGLPVSDRGQITELRLAQVVAVVTLATLGCKKTQNIAVHEPNLLGLTSGANVVYAETGAKPLLYVGWCFNILHCPQRETPSLLFPSRQQGMAFRLCVVLACCRDTLT
jgi:biotin synthase